jgi:hypothetical protein
MRLEEILESTMKEQNKIGENTFLKLRQQRDQARSECAQARIQRDVALRKLNKALDVIKEQRKLIEHGTETK